MDWYRRNLGRLFTVVEVMALLDELGVSAGAARAAVDRMDRDYQGYPGWQRWEPR